MDRRRLEAAFRKDGFEAIISAAPQTRLWYAKVQTSDGWLVIEPERATLFVDGRYFEYAKRQAQNVEVQLLKAGALDAFLRARNFQKIALERDYLTLEQKEQLTSMANLNTATVVLLSGQALRVVKTAAEGDQLQRAVDISLAAFDKLNSYLKEGISEREIDHKLNYLMKRLGADKEGFANIVAFGANTALPHHHPTDQKLAPGMMVTIDFGAQYQGYTADITRSFIFRPPGSTPVVDPKLEEILAVVEEAARRGRAAVKPGIAASAIDQICRDYIREMGYGNFFVHSTGHGVGLDVHEFPRVSHQDHTRLEPGMVITVEPGIYIEGLGGARIEDDILVTSTGHKVLSRKQVSND